MSIERFPVEEGHIMLFARAVGDPNPVYSDAAYAAESEVGGIIAPPTFVQSSVHFASERKLGGATPPQVPNPRGLHAEQEFQYHRPLRPGDVLSVDVRPGERWEKQGRSGKLIFSERIIEYRDQQGDLVVTARSIAVVTEQAVPKEAR